MKYAWKSDFKTVHIDSQLINKTRNLSRRPKVYFTVRFFEEDRKTAYNFYIFYLKPIA